MRQNRNNLRRITLLKKVNYYQYLIAQGGPRNAFMSNAPLNHDYNFQKGPIFPNIKQSIPKHLESTLENEQLLTKTYETNHQTEINNFSSTSREPKVHKTMIAESFRPNKKEDVQNLRQLVAKSLTPSIRINKAQAKRQKRCKSIDISNKLYFGEVTPTKDRIYIGKVSYAKPNTLRPPRLQIPSSRKPSISGWQIDISPVFPN